MDSVTLKAPAKVNLFLNVLAKRKDGYHDIVTLFERIGLCDRITLSRKQKRSVTVSCNGNIPQKDNLAYKAACMLLVKAGLDRGVHIAIEKNIPVAAGLGGGSSDAAATLIGLNRLYKLGFTKEELLNLGSRIGSDVPFFVLEESFALGRERGDKVEGLPFKPEKMWHLVVFPGVKKLTRDVYGALRLNLTTRPGDVKILLHALKTGDLGLIKEATYNRLEGPAFDRDPGLVAIKSALIRSGMEGALLTGSGPTIFTVTGTRKEAVALKERVLDRAIGAGTEGWQVFIARTM